MSKTGNKKGEVALLSALMALALCGALALNLLFIGGLISGKWIWLGLALVAFTSVGVNISSVAKRNRPEGAETATMPKAIAVALVGVVLLWVLTMVISLTRM